MSYSTYKQVIEKLQEMAKASGTEDMLVKVALPNSDGTTYTHLNIENISVYPHRDPGEENWVVYIKPEEE